jgi:dienelactone hydrolase
MKIIRNSILFISVLLLCSSCAFILNFNDLPEPKGQYIVGTDLFVWEDSYRDEWFTKDKIDSRKIVVQIWYPASEKSDSLYPYMDYKELRINAIAEQIGQPKALVKPAANVQGNSYFKAPLVDGKFPLILFSHGLGGYKTQNSINIETLVSNGYIVIAPDHTYDANITAFPDGSVAEYKSNLPENYSAQEFWDNRLPQLNTRANDLSFIIDKLQIMKQNPLYYAIEFDKIGVFGHSFGGATSIVSSWNDTRISACLNLDGWLVPVVDDIINTGLKIPFCYIGQEQWIKAPLNYEKLDKFYKNSTSDSFILKIKGTKHMDYADMPHFSNIGRKIASGKNVDKEFTNRISNSILGFFNDYLKDDSYNWTESIISNYETSIQFK